MQMLILPLKPTKSADLVAPLNSWLVSTSKYPPSDCDDGLTRLSSLRNSISKAIKSPSGHAHAMRENVLRDLNTYHAMLLECEKLEFPIRDGEADELILEWRCAFDTDGAPIIRSNLRFERLCTLYNIAALESYLASVNPSPGTKESINEEMRKYKSCAALLKHLKSIEGDPNPTIDLTEACLTLCETIMLAQAQACFYKLATIQSKHNMLAKLAMGAGALYNEALVQSRSYALKNKMPVLDEWSPLLKSMGMLFRSRAEYHESVHCQESAVKKGSGYGLEIARLKVAMDLCEQAFFSAKNASQDDVVTEIESLKRLILTRKEEAEQDNDTTYHEPIPDVKELQVIRGIITKNSVPMDVKALEYLEKPLFDDVLTGETCEVLNKFSKQRDEIVQRCEMNVKSHSDEARASLARVNLPQSLSTYKSSGKGLPNELWQKVQNIQKTVSLDKLKLYSWHLGDVSSTARSTITEITNLLDNDITLDEEFRREFKSFSGPSIHEMQKKIRHCLVQCDKHLSKAREGDSHITKMLEAFENDPKFELLQCDKATLDVLIPSDKQMQEIDTTILSTLLGQLTCVIKERQSLLVQLKETSQGIDFKYKIKDTPNQNGNEIDYDDLMQKALKPIQQLETEIQSNIQSQPDLIEEILQNNEVFVNAKKDVERSSSNQGKSSVDVIEEALKEILTVKNQLHEGKQFYDSITLNLKELKNCAEELSARLTHERIEFEDKDKIAKERFMQESTDIELAKRLAKEAKEYNMTEEERQRSEEHRKMQELKDMEYAKILAKETAAAEKLLEERKEQEDKDAEFARQIAKEAQSASSCLKTHDELKSDGVEDKISNGYVSNAASASSLTNKTPGNDDPPPPSKYTPPKREIDRSNSVRPGVVNVRHDRPYVPVDDAKVAALVEMGFDQEASVRALEKHDNNVEAALNDLFS